MKDLCDLDTFKEIEGLVTQNYNELFNILEKIKYINYAVIPDDIKSSKIEDLQEMTKQCGKLKLDELVKDGVITP